jgi:hypothetical protein
MSIEMTNDEGKVFHVRTGDAGIFGEDSDVRRKMTPPDCVNRFREIWSTKLENAVEEAQIITFEEASELLNDNRRLRLLSDWEQRQFSLLNVPFIAQVKKISEGHYACNALWVLGRHRDNTRLSVYFDTVAQRERFEAISRRLSWESRELAKKILDDFMDSVDRRPVGPS